MVIPTRKGGLNLLVRITEDMIAKLGLSMIEIGFTNEDINAALNSIMIILATETIAKINLEMED